MNRQNPFVQFILSQDKQTYKSILLASIGIAALSAFPIWYVSSMYEFATLPIKTGKATITRLGIMLGTRSLATETLLQVMVKFRGEEFMTKFNTPTVTSKIGDMVNIRYREKPNGAILVQDVVPELARDNANQRQHPNWDGDSPIFL